VKIKTPRKKKANPDEIKSYVTNPPRKELRKSKRKRMVV
jgi:hypothetical protein